ncbi:hypothetical protein [Sabulicella glaciei]|uniref:Plasmid replication protein n=1 Tax=Sabulicella glaciei TaxID=2984948 RepID=A0ABT3P1L2_9PROT|nr:hypothetical protein [Roseococcus sp. MDT2-1-1]MCW8088286.1 hypothetical protein [Roseococcus sp. MDT2-1-1]
MSKSPVRRYSVSASHAQLALWETDDPNRTNMVALYDMAPRFVFEDRDALQGRSRMIEREFSFGQKRYRITLKPTQIRAQDGTIQERFLSEREQIVEEVIRRLASKRGRLAIHHQKVRFTFSLHEVRTELKRVRHAHSYYEIQEAITLLSEVRLVIQDLDAKGSPVLSSAAFPVLGFRRKDSDDGETFVEFNPLVSDAIRLLEFTQVDYETLMTIRDPVARWLLKRLHNQVSHTRQPVQQILASEIRRDSGMPIWKTTRNLLRRVAQAVDVLKDAGVLDHVETEELMEGQKKVDLLFTMSASPDFMAKIHASSRIARENKEAFAALTSGRAPADGFAPISAPQMSRLRASRSPAAAALVEGDAEAEEDV